jgi:ribonucleoside-diphosphate reductase alpha chain
LKNSGIDFDILKRIVWSAVHFLDNVIDVNKYPLPKIKEMTLANRKIGLGVMGFADMLIEMGIPYNTQEAVDTAEKVMGFIQREARLASAALAEVRGPFPNFDSSIFAGEGRPKLRNATLTTIAPTGTISIIAGASSGIEPVFAISYIRNVMDNDELLEVNPLFERMARESGFYSEALMRMIAAQGHLKDLPEVPPDIARVFVTAHETTPEWHIRMQAAFQKYTDNAVSKTVNFPSDATIDDIARVYHLAWRLGCKGVTVYRDKSRDQQVLNIEAVNREEEAGEDAAEQESPRLAHRTAPRHRKDVIRGATRRMKTGCGNLYVTINEDDEGLFEIFTAMGKAGGCAASQAEATSRLISLALRAGVETESILRQIRGISCPAPAWENGEMIMSCSDGIAKAIERYIAETSENGKAVVEKIEAKAREDVKRPVYHTPVPPSGPIPTQCPDCGSRLELGGGCAFCRGCGYYRCG